MLDRERLHDLYNNYGLSKPEHSALSDYLKEIEERAEVSETSKNANQN